MQDILVEGEGKIKHTKGGITKSSIKITTSQQNREGKVGLN